MNLFELKKQLSEKTLQPLYIFTGEEFAVMDIYINKVAEVMGVKPKRVDSVAGIYANMQNQSLLVKASCYVIRDDKDYLAQDGIWDDMAAGFIQGNNVIILIYTNLDKRSKFYKQHNKSFTEFEYLSAEVLAKYIDKDIGLDNRRAITLANLCDCNYGRIILECDKLYQLSKARGIDIAAAFEIALAEGLIYTAPRDVMFDMIDAVCKRQPKASYALMEEVLATNDSPLGAISLLYTNFKSMLLVSGAKGKNIAETTGLTAWQIKLAKEKGNHYSIGELVNAVRLIRETERGIKTGGIEQKIALEYILTSIL